MVTTLCITSLNQGKIVPKHYFEIKSDEEIAVIILEEASRQQRIESARKWLASHLSFGQVTAKLALPLRLFQKQLS